MKLSERLDQIIAQRHLLQHPFYQAWTRGELSLDVLQHYAAEYFAQVDAFPRWVSAVHSRCPKIEARKVLLENLVDEEIRGVDHPELWLRFADALGTSREDAKQGAKLPTTQAAVDTLFALTGKSWTEGLCALYAYESQVPAVAESKMDGLKKFYGITDPEALKFFSLHLSYDVEHSKQVASLIDQYGDGQYADAETAEKATAEAADALYKFLDGFPVPECHAAA